MKKKFRKVLAGSMAVILMAASFMPIGLEKTYAATGDEIRSVDRDVENDWEYEVSGGKATIVSYLGSDTELEIPSKVCGYDVTFIKYEAFYGCDTIESVVIPEGVTGIGNYAFASCTNLKTVVLPESITGFGKGVFSCCDSLNNVVLPSGITEIPESMFYWCDSLTSIVIPDGVKSIGNAAFMGCDLLEEVELPYGLETIGEDAFASCDKIKYMSVLDGAKSIGARAFEHCYGLEMIFLPDSVTEIGYSAFLRCESLESIELPANLEKIGNSAFLGCEKLTSVKFSQSITSIGIEAFAGCKSLEIIALPESIKAIEDETFSSCFALTDIYIPDGVTSIGDGAFNSCYSLESIEIPSGVTSIGEAAFQFCEELKEIQLPSGIKTIEKNTFDGCEDLTEVIIPDGVTSIGDYAFEDCSGLVYIEIPYGVTTIGREAFNCCTYMTSAIVPSTVYNIGEDAFNGSRNIVIYCSPNTAAYLYATENDLPWAYIEDREEITGVTVTLDEKEYVYNAKPKRPTVTVMDGEEVLVENVHYIVSYHNNVFPGIATVTIKGIGFYKGEINCDYTIKPREYTAGVYYFDNFLTKWNEVYAWCWVPDYEEWSIDNEFTEWPGKQLEIDETTGFYCFDCDKIPTDTEFYVMFNNGAGGEKIADHYAEVIKNNHINKVFVPGYWDEDYKIWYGDWVEFDDGYNYSIYLEEENITLAETEFKYDGTEKTPAVTVVYNGDTLVEGVDYTVSYEDNIKSGIATVIIKGKGNFYGEVEKTFVIYPEKVKDFRYSARSSSAIQLSWNEDPSAYGYVIEQYKDGKWVEIVEITDGSDTTYKVTGLSPSTSYKFRICAYVADDEKKYCGEYVEYDTETLPIGVKTLTYSARSSSAVVLKWSGDSRVDGYVLEQYKAGKWVVIKTIAGNSTTSYKVTGLSASTACKFRIRAYKNYDKVVIYGGYTTKTINTLPAGVKSFTYSARSSSAVVLKWAKNTSASGYVIEQYKGGKWVAIKTITKNSTTSYKVTGLKASTANKFRIKAYKSYGTAKLYSGYVSKSVNTLPAGVAGFTYSARTNKTITLKWKKNTSASGYVIEQYKSGKWVKIKTATKNSIVSYKVLGLKKATSYKFRIKAYKSYGKSKLYSGYVTKTIKTK